jgi:AcrR family transcriptional regulator
LPAAAPAPPGRPRAAGPNGAARISLSKVEQKAETRARLRMAALTLFATKGYDATSASEIAALAGVSDRTFFLHFPTKSDAIMGIAEDRLLDLLADKIDDCPAGKSDLEVLEQSLIAWLEAAGAPEVLHRRAQLVLQAAALSPTVRGKLLDTSDAMVTAAAQALAHRRKLQKPTLEMKVGASVMLRVFQDITAEWAEHPAPAFRSVAKAHFQAFRHAVNADRRPLTQGGRAARRTDPRPTSGAP